MEDVLQENMCYETVYYSITYKYNMVGSNCIAVEYLLPFSASLLELMWNHIDH